MPGISIVYKSVHSQKSIVFAFSVIIRNGDFDIFIQTFSQIQMRSAMCLLLDPDEIRFVFTVRS